MTPRDSSLPSDTYQKDEKLGKADHTILVFSDSLSVNHPSLNDSLYGVGGCYCEVTHNLEDESEVQVDNIPLRME